MDNLFFDPGAEDPVVAVDWQICGLGRARLCTAHVCF